MKIFQKIKFQKAGKVIKKYKVAGITLLRKEKSLTKKKWNFLGLKFCKKKKKLEVVFPQLVEMLVWKSPENVHNPKRVAIFASFSKNGKIADYVVYYLTELKKICDAIIFIADNPIIPSEVEKIKKLVVYAKFERHDEYDFGSYKRGYIWAQQNELLDKAEELVLCNDSCFGPVYPFAEMFAKMKDEKADFWGLSNYDIHYHIQSFFMVLKQQVFKSNVFAEFMTSVAKQDNFWDVVMKYEIGLSDILHKAGYISASVVPNELAEMKEYSKQYNCYNKTCFPILLLGKYHFPLIKVKIFSGDSDYLTRCFDNREQLLADINRINSKAGMCIQTYLNS